MRKLLTEAAEFLMKKRRRRIWARAVGALACVVVFCTTYALILPAITLERTACGQEEHTHTEECYAPAPAETLRELICTRESLGVHTHTEDCYDQEGNLLCGYADYVVHTHDENCYDADGRLICWLPELEEHIHTAECYAPGETVVIDEGHTHTDDCYGQERGELICGLEETAGHAHGEDCYNEAGNLICTLDESEGHQHNDSCYAWNRFLTCGQEERPAQTEQSEPVLICDKYEVDTHTHTESCYDEDGYLICGKPEVLKHRHTEQCFQVTEKAPEEPVLICEKEEHTHTEDCFAAEQPEEPEAEGPEQPGEPDYFCGKEEHIHDEECYDETGSLTCALEEHTHSENCLAPAEELESESPEQPLEEETDAERSEQPAETGYLCGKDEHVHDESCYDEAGNLICTVEEHAHSEACLTPAEEPDGEEPAPEEELTRLRYTGPDYAVDVSYGADAALPEGVSLTVREITSDTEEYWDYYAQSVEALGISSAEVPGTLTFARFFDIQFILDGQTVEPAGPVSVTITYDQTMDVSGAEDCKAIHFGEEGTELLEVDAQSQEEDQTTTFTHTQDGFSVVGSLMTVNYAEGNNAETGPDALPVDYYVCIDGEWVCVGSTKTGWYGDYTAGNWTNENRDCITVEQVDAVLGDYGFEVDAANAALQLAYQRKETDKDAYLHCDTQSYAKDGTAVIPLARNVNAQSGYNLYFLPGNQNNKLSIALDNVDTDGSTFYTVSVFDPNHLAYANGEYLPETQTLRAGSDTTVTVRSLPEDSGASWQCINSSWNKVADGTENSDGTVAFQLTNVTQKLRITPVVTALGNRVEKTVYFLVFLDGQWTEVGTTTPYYENESLLQSADKTQRRHFLTSSQAESVLAPFGFRSDAYSSSIDGTSALAHQLGKYDFTTKFWTDGGGERLADGSWAIGLGYTTNVATDYSVYYLPTAPERFQGKKPSECTSESAEMYGNRFWSVSVRDDTHSVYSEGELSQMVQYVADGGTATVTVRNAEGILWSCVGKNGEPLTVESSQSDGSTTYIISNITQPVEVVATKANPGFTVQYYANIPRFATSGDNPLKVIDTSGKALPTNGGSMATRNLYLEGTGNYTGQNAGTATELYQVKTVSELTKMYTEGEYHFEESPDLIYFNKLKDNEDYVLEEIWVLKEGKDAASTNPDDWDIYTYAAEKTAFTNEAGQAVDDTIRINDGAVLRLVFDASSGDYHNGTTFYDYNISSGQNSDGRWRTGITGINSESNYGTSLNGQRTWRSGADILAFGNANCGTGMSGYLFAESTLNKYSSKNSGYGGATFGLASALNKDGTIRYNDWIVAPKLFNDGDATGKQTYSGSSLTFDRVGDTYTLSAATLNNSNGQSNTLSGLQYFFNPSPTSGTTHTHIFTNNFWPMDPAAGRTDALWGTYGNPGRFQGFVETNDYKWSGLAANFPVSDDGNAHNWFFGMNFAISFSLTADYEGPLEYYFFGDDDLWVFLDNQLVCDIGGVHSSIGEYVNLRDYLPVGSSGQHTLSFFYTERGASGSTCYMSFTLPSVSSATTSRDTGSLQIAKSLDGNISDSSLEFQFCVELLTSENGSPLKQTFSYARSDGTYGTVKSGGTVKLGASETLTISGIPAGTYYRVTELSTEGYKTTVNGSEGYIVSGKIETGEIKPASFVNTPYYELPSTGGPGTLLYTSSGLALMLGAALMYKILRRRRGAE